MNTELRIQNLRRAMARDQVECLLISDEINVRYLSGFTGDSSALLVTLQDAWILSDRRYEEQISRECTNWKSRIRGPERRLHHLIIELVDQLGLKRLSLEDHAITWVLLQTLAKESPHIELQSTSGIVGALRAIKDADELALLRRAIHISEKAFLLMRASLRPGMTELDVAYLLETAIRSFGGSGTGFASIIAVGESAALPHYHPSTNKVTDGLPLLVDWGAKFQGYTSDMTRTLSVGTITPKMQQLYPVVLDAHLAAIDAIRPGARLCDVDAAARQVIDKAGYGQAFSHGLGHGIGLQVHESPRMASIEQGELLEGMVITVEPGVYLPGELGIRIEDDVLVTANGCEVLCSLPKGLEENLVIL